MILCLRRFTCDCKNIFHIYFEVRVQNSWGWFTVCSHCPMLDGLSILDRFRMCIGSATHSCRENPPVFFMLKHGNWLHNSFRRKLRCWYLTHLWCDGGMWQWLCFHHTSWRCIMHAIAQWVGGGQGPCGGCALVYTHFYTDQEKWSVNHITYIVVYTEQCSQKRVL